MASNSFRVLAVPRTHASPDVLLDTVKAWVDRVVRFLQIDESHVHGDFFLSVELLERAHDDRHIDRLSCGAETPMLPRD